MEVINALVSLDNIIRSVRNKFDRPISPEEYHHMVTTLFNHGFDVKILIDKKEIDYDKCQYGSVVYYMNEADSLTEKLSIAIYFRLLSYVKIEGREWSFDISPPVNSHIRSHQDFKRLLQNEIIRKFPQIDDVTTCFKNIERKS